MVAVAGTKASPPCRGVEAPEVLHEEAPIGLGAEQGGGEEEEAPCGEDERAVAEEGEVDQGPADAPLHGDERGEEENAEQGGSEDERIGRGAPGDQGDREHQAEEAAGEERQPPPIDARRGVFVARLGDVAEGHDQGEEAERQIDQEDRPPVVAPDEEAAEDRPRDEPEPGDAAVDADGEAALSLREGAGGDGKGAGGHNRRADPLDDPRRDQRADRRCDGAGDGGSDEEEEPREVEAALPPDVAEPPEAHRQDGDHQRVPGDRPGDAAGRGPEIAPDRGEGDVDDEEIDVQHHQPGAGGEQGQPFGAGGARGHWGAPDESWVVSRE